MADITINNLPPVTGVVNLTDVVPISQNNATYKASVSQLLAKGLPLAEGIAAGTSDFYERQFLLTSPGFLIANAFGEATYSFSSANTFIYAALETFISLYNNSLAPTTPIPLGTSITSGNRNFNTGLSVTTSGLYYCSPGTYRIESLFSRRIVGSGVSVTLTSTNLSYIVVPANT